MSSWKQRLADNLVPADELAEKFALNLPEFQSVAQHYPVRISRHYFNLIREKGDPIWRQAVPDIVELHDDCQKSDPLNEQSLSPVPGLIHRYPDRVVWLVSNECAVYCRFCMRKRRVGCASDAGLPESRADALGYIATDRKSVV